MDTKKVRYEEFLAGIKEGNLDAVRAMLEVRPGLVNAPGENGMSTVVTALHHGHPSVARLLAEQKLHALRKGSLRRRELYQAIHDFGEAGLIDAERDVLEFLAHGDPGLRHIALSVLTLHWDRAAHRGEIERLLVEDPDPQVRGMAAAGLGFVLRSTRDPRATKALLQRLRDETEHPSVRKAAYRGLLDVWFPESARPTTKYKELETALTEVEKALDHAQRVQRAMTLPKPLRDLEFTELDLEPKEDWRASVDWDLVASIEREDTGQR